MRSTLSRLGLIVLLILTDAAVASAQTVPRAGSRVPATIVLSDDRAAASRFVVQRSPGAARHDVIILASDASEDEFADAVRTLLTVRQKEGDVPALKQTLRMRPKQASTARRPAYPWAARVLADLRRSNRVEIDGIGRVRAVQIWLPSQGSRSAAGKG